MVYMAAAAAEAEASLPGTASGRTRARVATLAAAYRSQRSRVAELLQPLALAPLPLPRTTPPLSSTRAAAQSS